MQIKVLEFILAQLPNLQEFVSNKIQELEDTMVGTKGIDKKAELDKSAIAYMTQLIQSWDIKQVPNIIEDNLLDPACVEAFKLFIPQITQSLYNIGVKGINKIQEKI